jgi:D-xylose transport system substrate-binding protein
VAIAIIKGRPVKTNATINNGSRVVPAIFLTPVTITKRNYELLFREGFLRRNQVCVGKYRKYCN